MNWTPFHSNLLAILQALSVVAAGEAPGPAPMKTESMAQRQETIIVKKLPPVPSQLGSLLKREEIGLIESEELLLARREAERKAAAEEAAKLAKKKETVTSKSIEPQNLAKPAEEKPSVKTTEEKKADTETTPIPPKEAGLGSSKKPLEATTEEKEEPDKDVADSEKPEQLPEPMRKVPPVSEALNEEKEEVKETEEEVSEVKEEERPQEVAKEESEPEPQATLEEDKQVKAEPVPEDKKSTPQEVKAVANAPTIPTLPLVPQVAIILSNTHFYPAKIKLRQGLQTKLIFTTTNKKPAALIIERLEVQRWIAKENEPVVPASEKPQFEVNREIGSNRVTEVILDPQLGNYSFHDAITGAVGEIIVE